jgi:hypothetical protein
MEKVFNVFLMEIFIVVPMPTENQKDTENIIGAMVAITKGNLLKD